MNEGDCDSDSDCAGSLICRNRNDGKVDLVSIFLEGESNADPSLHSHNLPTKVSRDG